MAILSYFLALTANFCFASASLVFTHFSKRTNVYWVNMFKAMVALVAGLVAMIFLDDLTWTKGQIYFVLSGMIGLLVADVFLLKAFLLLGPGRSLVLFGFQPLFIGITAYYLFGQTMTLMQLVSIFFLLACLFVFSLENKRMYKSWGIKGLAFALIAIILDGVGLLLSKAGFEASQTHFIQANMIRSVGAFVGFYILSFFISFPLVFTYKKLSLKEKYIISIGCFFGTFLALSLYMWAIDIGHLASLTAITVTSPFMAAALEAVINKKMPSKYFFVAFLFFIIGFVFLVGPKVGWF